MRRAVLIYNPGAGQWRRRTYGDRVLAHLKTAYEVELAPTTGPGHATELARRAAADGVEVAFALGGDGTLREVAAGLLGSSCALGPLPSGTTNVVVRSLGVPGHPVAAARLLAQTEPSSMDVGWCNEHPFLMQVSAGLDGEALRRVHLGLKRALGKTAVAIAGAQAWWNYDYREIFVDADGREVVATFLAVGSLPHYAGSMQLFPGRIPDDGKLSLVAFRGDRASTLGFAADLARGAHTRRADVDFSTVEKVRIEGPKGVPIQIDGDLFDLEPPIEIRLAAERLRVLAPALSPSATA